MRRGRMPRDHQRKIIDAVRRSDRKFGLHATEEVEILRNGTIIYQIFRPKRKSRRRA